MEHNNLIKKGVVISVILLFIGLAFAPSINANISNVSVNNELVEITTEIYGIDGVKPYSMKLTKQESIEIEQLFNEIKSKLDKVETREEAVEIFNEAVVELDRYGLLGGLNVKQAQRLVTGRYKISRLNGFIEKKLMNNPWIPPEDIFNTKCFVVSRVIGDGIWDATLANLIFCGFFVALGLYPLLLILFTFFLYFVPSDESLDRILHMLDNYTQNKPLRLLSLIFIGREGGAHGDFLTIGSYGKKYCSYSASFYFLFFSGIKIKYDAKNWDSFYFGYSNIVGKQD